MCQASCASELKRNITAPAKAGEALGVQEFAAADDGGSPNCVDTRQEDVMVLVLNHDDDPLEHGFSDVGSNGLYHGLIVRGIDAGTTYNYQRLWAYEFRYDGGRERYLARRLNPANPDPTAQGGILDETWTDYDLDGSVYGDYQVAGGGTVTELQRYVPGLAQQSVAGAAEYFLGDQIGTTRFLTDESTPVATTNRRVYTAFGELVEMTGTGQTRYGYAGAWGYQEHDADLSDSPDNILGSPPTGPAIGEVFPFLHVGWRYYDPSTGRFLQRDPIGIWGGLNVYGYVAANPVRAVDPDGCAAEPIIPDAPPGVPPTLGETIDHAGHGACVGGLVGGSVTKTPKGALIGAGGGALAEGGGYLLWTSVKCMFFDLWGLLHELEDLRCVTLDDLRRMKKHPEIWESYEDFIRRYPGLQMCFAEGTRLWVGGELCCIEDVAVGCRIDSAVTGEATVVRVRKAVVHSVLRIFLDDEMLQCTASHPFLVAGRGWVAAGDLRTGDVLEAAGGMGIPIVGVKVEHIDGGIRVFDLTVEPGHEFLVGENRIRVHNKD